MGRAEAVQACRTWLAMYPGMLAPSHICSPRRARRRSGGVVITTYAAATPAEMSTTIRDRAGVGTRHGRLGATRTGR